MKKFKLLIFQSIKNNFKSGFIRKIFFIVATILFHNLVCFAEPIITLQDCYKSIYTNYPLIKNKNIILDKEKILTEIIEKGWKPGINIKSQMTGQSDAVPKTPREKYGLQADIEQLIYDGGLINKKIILESENSKVEILKNENELYQLRDKVNQFFFDIILNENQIEILKTSYQDLDVKLKSIESAVRNGVRLKTDALIIRSEIINIEKEISEKINNRKNSILMLSSITGEKFEDTSIFKIPQLIENNSFSGQFDNRLELKIFEQEKRKLFVVDDMNYIKNKPVIYSFAQTGYANPALNMFEDKFEFYLIAGFRISWKPYNWGIENLEKKVSDERRKIIDIQKEDFIKKLNINELKLKNEIENLKILIIKDLEIIKIKTEILESITSQFNNGVLNSTDFILHTNSLINAKKLLELRNVQLAYFKILLKTLRGEEL